MKKMGINQEIMQNLLAGFYMSNQKTIYAKFHSALDDFIDFVKQDQSIIAGLLFGSLIEGNVWEKSDLDLILITNDEKTPYKFVWLDEDNLNFQVTVYSRTRFKKLLEQNLTGSWVHHMIGTSQVLFSNDPAIQEHIKESQNPGHRDIELQILTIVSMIIGDLEKAEKFLLIKKDVPQSYLFITRLLDHLAQVEVLLQNKVPGREAISQAMATQPDLFKFIFDDVILLDTDEKKMAQICHRIRSYLIEQTELIFRIIIEYFRKEGDVRSISDLSLYLNKLLKTSWWEIGSLAFCEWLVDQGYLERFTSFIRLTTRSRIQVKEIAYIYAGDDE